MIRAAVAFAAVLVISSSSLAHADVRLVIPGTSRILALVCDAALGPAVIAPVPGDNSIGADHAVALIVETPDAEPEIVTGISEFYAGGLGARVGVAVDGQLLQALQSDNPVRIARENAGYVVPAQNATAAIASLARSCRKEPIKTGPMPPGSYWAHNGSIVRLEASRTVRRFTFYKVSEPMAAIGAKAGSLRFEGHIAGETYAGEAILYTEKCGTFRYQVSGRIENNDERVVLTGQAPKLNSACREIGKRDLTLTFDFIKPTH